MQMAMQMKMQMEMQMGMGPAPSSEWVGGCGHGRGRRGHGRGTWDLGTLGLGGGGDTREHGHGRVGRGGPRLDPARFDFFGFLLRVLYQLSYSQSSHSSHSTVQGPGSVPGPGHLARARQPPTQSTIEIHVDPAGGAATCQVPPQITSRK